MIISASGQHRGRCDEDVEDEWVTLELAGWIATSFLCNHTASLLISSAISASSKHGVVRIKEFAQLMEEFVQLMEEFAQLKNS